MHAAELTLSPSAYTLAGTRYQFDTLFMISLISCLRWCLSDFSIVKILISLCNNKKSLVSYSETVLFPIDFHQWKNCFHRWFIPKPVITMVIIKWWFSVSMMPYYSTLSNSRWSGFFSITPTKLLLPRSPKTSPTKSNEQVSVLISLQVSAEFDKIN